MTPYRIISFSRGFRGKVSCPRLKPRKRTPLLLPFVPRVESRGKTISRKETYHHRWWCRWYITPAPIALHIPTAPLQEVSDDSREH